ncbi:MAG: peptidase S8 [Candidatus Rokuibacteriota bacterium]|nr:MAG: peptidase S8 [Candidatus Rokubacteria bacterium]
MSRRRAGVRVGLVLGVSFLLLGASSVAAQPLPRHAPDTVLVRFAPSTPPSEQALAHALVGARVLKSFTIVEGLHVVRLPPGMRVKAALEAYRRHPAVVYAEPDWIVERQTTPNDPSFGELWGLNNTGQSGGVPDADIDAVEAWNITTGSSDVVVAVIDTGVDYNHQDLSANMYRSARDCVINGIDDDGNGQIDDCFGIDTANNDSDPMDDHGHGTHVSGTIGAVGNNGVGVVGVNWTVRIMACKFLNASGSGTTSDAIDCLEYVKLMKDRGVNIVATNNSWGGGGFSQALLDAIEAHLQRGILFIAAAGNNSSDNDVTPAYPAGYNLPNILAVAATTRTDALASFSNFGRRTVHLGAPGQEILSTTPGNTYSVFSGTSMATPHVTGVAALLKAQDPSRDWRALKNLILAGGDPNFSLTNTITQRRLNARGALACANTTVLSRLLPAGGAITGAVGTPVVLAALHINCAIPNGNLTVTVDPGGQSVVLTDDGLGADRAAGDGIYSGQWTPTATGTYFLTFPGGDTVTVQVLSSYTVTPTAFSYRTISGSNLNLDDDSSVGIGLPFPIAFAGGSFSVVFVGSNGNVSFTAPFIAYLNEPIPTTQIATLVAPWWDDLLPLVGTSQNVFWAVTGTAPNRELVVEWRDVPHYECGPSAATTVKFQAVFFEGSSNILFNYADATFGGGCAFDDRGASATVGVQTGAGLGTSFSFNTQSLSSGLALLWTTTAGSPALNVSPSSRSFGNVPLGGSEDRSFTVQNVGGGTITGSATTSPPFAVVAGGAYALTIGQSQQVTVRFAPTSVATFTGSVTFGGGAGTTRSVSGSGISVSPVAPAALTATAVSPSQIDLAWLDNNGNETEIRIERKTGAGGTFGQIAVTGANSTMYSDAGRSPATTYVYRVRACNTVGCSDYSAEATATTPALPVVVSLSVVVNGSAAGTVTSVPVGISCAPSCAAGFTAGTTVTLTTAPGARARFKSWGGACSGSTATCTLTLNDVASVTATFQVIFTDAAGDDRLPAGTPIKLAHFTELLDAINAVQPGTNLSWSIPAPTGGGAVLLAHINALRLPLGLPAVDAGSVIRAAHIDDVRLRIRALE